MSFNIKCSIDIGVTMENSQLSKTLACKVLGSVSSILSQSPCMVPSAEG